MEKIVAHIAGEIISSNSAEAHSLYQKSCFGEPVGDKIQYSFSEAIFLAEKGKIEIFSQNPELGENKSELFGKIEGKEVEVSFNFKFILEGLAHIKTKEVIFELNGLEGPAILKPLGDESYLYVVMPIKAS